MKDDAFDECIEAVEELIRDIRDEDIEEEPDNLLERGLDIVSDARELLSLGNGRIMIVEEQNSEIVEKPLEF